MSVVTSVSSISVNGFRSATGLTNYGAEKTDLDGVLAARKNLGMDLDEICEAYLECLFLIVTGHFALEDKRNTTSQLSLRQKNSSSFAQNQAGFLNITSTEELNDDLAGQSSSNTSSNPKKLAQTSRFDETDFYKVLATFGQNFGQTF